MFSSNYRHYNCYLVLQNIILIASFEEEEAGGGGGGGLSITSFGIVSKYIKIH